MIARPVIQVRSISAAVALSRPKLAQETFAAAASAPGSAADINTVGGNGIGRPRYRAPEDEDKGIRQIARRTKACRDALRAFENPSWLRADAAQGTFRGTRRIPFSRHRPEPQNAGAPDPSAATNAISRIVRLNSHMAWITPVSQASRSDQNCCKYQLPTHLSQMRQPRRAFFRQHRPKSDKISSRGHFAQHRRSR